MVGVNQGLCRGNHVPLRKANVLINLENKSRGNAEKIGIWKIQHRGIKMLIH